MSDLGSCPRANHQNLLTKHPMQAPSVQPRLEDPRDTQGQGLALASCTCPLLLSGLLYSIFLKINGYSKASYDFSMCTQNESPSPNSFSHQAHWTVFGSLKKAQCIFFPSSF